MPRRSCVRGVAGPRLWNALPISLRQSDLSLGQFRRALKRICSIVSAGPSDLFLGADYKCAYLLTYLLTYLLRISRKYCTATQNLVSEVVCHSLLQTKIQP